MRTAYGTKLLRIHDNVLRLRTKSTPHSLHLLLHKTISTAVHFLSNPHSYPTKDTGPILNELLYDTEEIFGLIGDLIIEPFAKLEPTFQSRWTHYTATVPYEITWLNLQVILNNHAAYALLESERQNSSLLNVLLCFAKLTWLFWLFF